MRYIILATHGKFAAGIMDSLSMIYGELSYVFPYCAFVDPEENVTRRIHELLDSYAAEDEIIVLADLLGGSICNEFIRQLDRTNLHIIAGLNLAMVLELITHIEEPLTEALERAVAAAKASVVYCNQLINDDEGKYEVF